ncbi:MAG TPA: iron-containing alcohol dehydrogenase [Dongiaceae bacterium]|nr:iron-containing alcohol dehydrogenase [Dongiaceae bacterium]
MSALLLDQLLRGVLPDPDSAGSLAVPTQCVVMAADLRGAAADLVSPLAFGQRLLVVSDLTTQAILGQRIVAELATRFAIEHLVLTDPYADLATVGQIEARQQAAGAQALIAVGSGTLNDLCKYAAHRQAIPYAVFATAPSMNGYTSVSAAITVDGHKKSLPATAAAGVFADLSVLAKAPARMIQSGFGDSICRTTAQVDWLLAHLLFDQPYRQAPFSLLHADEAALLAAPRRLVEGDLGAIELLMRSLILSGFGMTICGGSYPASQGEHLISHYLEMLPPAGWTPALHGQQVAVATVTMSRLQERMLQAPPRLAATRVTEADLIAHFGEALGHSCWQGFSRKRLDAGQAGQLSGRLSRDWPEICARLAPCRLSATVVRDALLAAGAPVGPDDIGLTAGQYRSAVLHARQIRDRFTFLDLADDSGVLSGFARREAADHQGGNNQRGIAAVVR